MTSTRSVRIVPSCAFGRAAARPVLAPAARARGSGRHLPRGLDLGALADAELQEIVLTHNLTPRKCLGFLTPLQALLSLVCKAQGHVEEAIGWAVRSHAEFKGSPGAGARLGLAKIARLYGTEVVKEAWRRVTGQELPSDLHHVAAEGVGAAAPPT